LPPASDVAIIVAKDVVLCLEHESLAAIPVNMVSLNDLTEKAKRAR
jgi:hypothetical protein